MPAPVDLTGRRFGSLVALSRTRYTDGKTAWVCLCDCGRETTVPITRLSSVRDGNFRAIRACETCRSRVCVVCGELFLPAGPAKTCGRMACRQEYKRAADRATEARWALNHPGYKTEKTRERMARIREDPILYQQHLEYMREYYRHYRANMTQEQRLKRRSIERDYYARNRERIRALVKQRLENMPPERRAERADAKARAARDSRRRRALAMMMRQAAELLEKLDNERTDRNANDDSR